MTDKKLKIAILDFDEIRNPLLSGGQAWSTYEVGRRLVGKGHEVVVYCSRYPGCNDRFEEGIYYKHIGLGTKNIKVNNAAYFFAVPLAVYNLKADLIVECFTAPISVLLCPLWSKVPVVGLPTMFNAANFAKKYRLPFHLVEKFGMRFYKYMMPYSDIDYQKVKLMNPSIVSKIVPQGVGEEYLNIKKLKGEYVLFLGRFDIAQKGIDLLLEAYAKIAYEAKYPLVIAGHGPDEQKIRAHIHKLHLEKHVKIIGPLYGEKKRQVMARAVCVAFPSRHDELSLWALEALACGLPVVAFDIPEGRWMNDSVSIKAKAYDAADYANCLLKAIRLETNGVMKKNTRVFTKTYSWDRVANDYEDFMNLILEGEKYLQTKNQTLLTRLITVPQIKDEGTLCFMEQDSQIPFAIRRVYYILDIFEEAVRGKHAHKKTKQALFCIRGSMTIILDNGKEREYVMLNNPDVGVYIDRMVWHEMISFSKDAVLLAVASEKFDERDYIRNYDTFLELQAGRYSRQPGLTPPVIRQRFALKFRSFL